MQASAPSQPAPTPAPDASARRGLRGWIDALRVYAQPTVLRMLLLGFSAGLPLLLVFGTLSYWLREAGIDLTTIGFLSWVALTYAFKWVWAPLVDRMPLPGLTTRLGRRRGWLLAAQTLVAVGLVGMALTDPRESLRVLIAFAVLTAFASATQDIALDAFRIESAAVEQQAALAAAYQTGYRIAMVWAGAGVLAIAAHFAVDNTYAFRPWRHAYLVMAASMAVGMLTVLFSPEPAPAPREHQASEQGRGRSARLLAWGREAVIAPFADFFAPYGWQALLILALIATYRMSDVVMGVMANPFYRDMGFTKEEVAAVSKLYGIAMTLGGAFLGGVLAMRIGVVRTLFLGALLSAGTDLLFAWLATRGHDLTGLIFTVSADNLSAGIASAAFIAYLSGLTNVAYSATQYALFSSTMLLLPKFIAGFSGAAVDAWGYAPFFIGTAAAGLPVLCLIALAARMRHAHATAADNPRP